MIPLPYGHLFYVYICAWVLLLAVLWLLHEIRQRKTPEWFVVKERLYHCPNCYLSFMAQHDSENITRCPRCNEMCFLKKRRHF